MRIAQCTDTFLPIVDGVGRVAVAYANGLSRLGNETTVITPIQDAGFRGNYPFEILDFISIGIPTATQYKAGVSSLDSNYMAKIKKRSFDVVHAHSPLIAGWEALRLANTQKIPLVGTFHSKYRNDILRYINIDIVADLGTKYIVSFYERCDEVWTVSDHAAETLRGYGFNGEIQTISNGCDMKIPQKAWEEAARQTFHLQSSPILLYVGQLDYKKNIRAILEAAALLKRQGTDFQLVLAGQGQDDQNLRDDADTLGISRSTVFTGHLYEPDLLNGLYMSASLFVFPSLYDTGGLVVSEAAMMGTPSLVVKNGAPAERIIDRKNGLVCEDTPENIYKAMDYYLNRMDRNAQDRMCRQAQMSIPESWDIIMNHVQARYEELFGRIRTKR